MSLEARERLKGIFGKKDAKYLVYKYGPINLVFLDPPTSLTSDDKLYG